MLIVIGIAIGLAAGAGLAFLSLYAFTGSRLAAARRTRQLLVSEAKRESDALKREAQIEAREVHTKQLQEELKQARESELTELERISGMTINEAKGHLLERSEELVRHELARRVRQAEEEARGEAKRRA